MLSATDLTRERSHEPSSEYFNEHRHDSPEDQREYEQEHSLFLPK